MTEELVRKCAQELCVAQGRKVSENELARAADEVRAVIPVVLAEVQRHLSAVQYDPAPYTALKHRLAELGSI